jgi:hypothetical protein
MSATTDLEDLLGVTPLIKKPNTPPVSDDMGRLGMALRGYVNWRHSEHPLAVKAAIALHSNMSQIVEKIITEGVQNEVRA